MISPRIQVSVKGPFKGPLDYSCDFPVQAGQRVWVPLGSRKVIGLVVGLADAATDAPSLKAVEAVVDENPIVTPQILTLIQRLADYYHQPLGLIVDLALPSLLLRGRVYDEKLAKSKPHSTTSSQLIS